MVFNPTPLPPYHIPSQFTNYHSYGRPSPCYRGPLLATWGPLLATGTLSLLQGPYPCYRDPLLATRRIVFHYSNFLICHYFHIQSCIIYSDERHLFTISLKIISYCLCLCLRFLFFSSKYLLLAKVLYPVLPFYPSL